MENEIMNEEIVEVAEEIVEDTNFNVTNVAKAAGVAVLVICVGKAIHTGVKKGVPWIKAKVNEVKEARQSGKEAIQIYEGEIED